jgi:Putative protein-S-isoprenylcysteine methyltransferase
MLALQIYLLSGLVLHKVVWEVLKRKAEEKPHEPHSAKLLVIKAFKIFILLGIMIQIFLPDFLPIAENPRMLRIIGAVIYTAGLLTAVAARFQLGENWANIETGQVLPKQRVVARGVYGFIRHPIYTGDLLLLLGLELALNSWLVLGVFILAPVVMLKAVREERMLSEKLPGYEDYRARTKRFIPFVV